MAEGFSCSRSPEAVWAALRGLVSTLTPGTSVGAQFFRLATDDFAIWCRCGDCPFFHSFEYHCHSQNCPSENTAGESSNDHTATNMSRSLTQTAASSFVVSDPVDLVIARRSFDFPNCIIVFRSRVALAQPLHGCA